MEDLNFIKSIDIKSIIKKETGLQFKKNFLSKCPFCDSGSKKSKTPAFSVKTNSNIFNCFACGKKGGVIEFVKYYKELSNSDAIKYIAEHYSNEPQMTKVPEPKTDLSKKVYAIKQNDKAPAVEYLKSRAIATEKLNGSTFYYDIFNNAVVFFDTEEKVINKRFIKPEPGKLKAINDKGSDLKNAIYDKTYQPGSNKVFIVEGVINALSLVGYSSLAIFSTGNQFKNVSKLKKYLQGKEVVLAFDNDPAGQKCTEYYLDFIRKNIEVETITQLNLPEKIDINDLLQDNELIEHLDNADNYLFLHGDITKQPLKQNSDNQDKDYKEFGFYVKNSRYFTKKAKGDHWLNVEISDCIFKFLYRLNNDAGTRLVKVQQTRINGKQKRELIEVSSDELSKEKFKKILYTKGFNFIGSTYNLDKIVMYNTHQELQANVIETLGQQTDQNIYFFSDCAINSKNEIVYPNSLGIIESSGTTYYLPTASPAYPENNKSNELTKFKYRSSDISFERFAELFYKSNQESGSVGIQFYILSLFRDIVFDCLDYFPYLYLYGEAGGGKTSYIDTVLALFGDKSKGHGLKNITQAGLSRIASQKRNGVIYYKEYKKDVPNYVEDYLKTGYDGQSRTLSLKGTGNQTVSFGIESAGIIDSNFLPTNETAVFDRMIILDFEKNNFTDEQTKAYLELKGYMNKGMAQITRELLKHRELFKEKFKETFYKALDYLKQTKELKKKFPRERIIQHIALVLTPYHILHEKISFPFSFEMLENTIITHAEKQNEKLYEFKPTTVFWQALSFFKGEYKVVKFKGDNKSEAHYVKAPIDENNGSIYIKTNKLNILYSYYARHCKAIGTEANNIDSFTELKSKLLSKNYEPYQDNSKGNRVGKNIRGLGYSFEFRYTTTNNSESICIDGQELDL